MADLREVNAVGREHRALRRLILRLYANVPAWEGYDKQSGRAYRYAVDDVADWLERRKKLLSEEGTLMAAVSILAVATEASRVMLLDFEVDSAVPCACGHFLVRRGVRSHWYWQTHSDGGCALELPDLTCWCGLKRSEHITGHKEGVRPENA